MRACNQEVFILRCSLQNFLFFSWFMFFFWFFFCIMFPLSQGSLSIFGVTCNCINIKYMRLKTARKKISWDEGKLIFWSFVFVFQFELGYWAIQISLNNRCICIHTYTCQDFFQYCFYSTLLCFPLSYSYLSIWYILRLFDCKLCMTRSNIEQKKNR